MDVIGNGNINKTESQELVNQLMNKERIKSFTIMAKILVISLCKAVWTTKMMKNLVSKLVEWLSWS